MVYVDELFSVTPTRRWPWQKACHMTADRFDELHSFAAKLGLKHSYFQAGSMPHYDLTPGKRAQAVALGAAEITAEEAVARMRAFRAQKLNGQPTVPYGREMSGVTA
jgi:hypothetical protein